MRFISYLHQKIVKYLLVKRLCLTKYGEEKEYNQESNGY